MCSIMLGLLEKGTWKDEGGRLAHLRRNVVLALAREFADEDVRAPSEEVRDSAHSGSSRKLLKGMSDTL